MLRRIYDWVLGLAASRHAPAGLFAVAFAESSFFPIPPDVMLAPMVFARPQRAFVFAAICTLGSVLGGGLGYLIGFYLTGLGQQILSITGNASGMEQYQCWYAQWGLAVILIKGLTPIPYKLVTIASGLAHFSFPMFIAASVITRGARFFLVAGLFKYGGAPMRDFVERRLTLVTTILVVAVIAILVVLHYWMK
jgi:membrane protein YqaA with SNARE-associated domain